MMGQTTDNLDTPIVKTSTGVVILPRSHHVIERKLKPEQCPGPHRQIRLRPMPLLHRAIARVSCSATRSNRTRSCAAWRSPPPALTIGTRWAALCCACGLCTLYACPEELFPKEACDDVKGRDARTRTSNGPGPAPAKPHPMRDGRRVPIKIVAAEARTSSNTICPPRWQDIAVEPRQLVLPLKQSAGAAEQADCQSRRHASRPASRWARSRQEALGAILHAPIAGTVAEVTARPHYL